jgi:predicted RNase H-like HicB family nuclease
MERRKHYRVNFNGLLHAEEQVLIEDGTRLTPSTLKNLSEGGALVELRDFEDLLTAGKTYQLLLDNGGEVLSVDAIAIRTDGTTIAFQFNDLSTEDKKDIQTKIIRMSMISERIRNEAPEDELAVY